MLVITGVCGGNSLAASVLAVFLPKGPSDKETCPDDIPLTWNLGFDASGGAGLLYPGQGINSRAHYIVHTMTYIYVDVNSLTVCSVRFMTPTMGWNGGG